MPDWNGEPTRPHDPLRDELEALLVTPALSRALAAADRAQAREREQDPEWSVPAWVHLHSVIEAFAVGAISANDYSMPYHLPPKFGAVVQAFARFAQEKWRDGTKLPDVVQLSLVEIEEAILEFCRTTPDAWAWGGGDDGGDAIIVTHAESPTPSEWQWMSLGALARNAVMHLLQERRRNRAFDARFDAEWERDHGQGEKMPHGRV